MLMQHADEAPNATGRIDLVGGGGRWQPHPCFSRGPLTGTSRVDLPHWLQTSSDHGRPGGLLRDPVLRNLALTASAASATPKPPGTRSRHPMSGRPVPLAWPSQHGALRARWGGTGPAPCGAAESPGVPWCQFRSVATRSRYSLSIKRPTRSRGAVGQHLGRKRRRGLFVCVDAAAAAPADARDGAVVADHGGDPGAVRLDRRDRRDERLPSNDGLPSPSQSLTHAEALAALEVVASLPPRQRELIGLQVAGYSRREIAALTGTSPRAVERHLSRARTALREA